MPTYEYVCRSCGEHLEVVQSFKDEPLAQCPSCGGDLKKVFGNIGIVFKGSGFYKTDSRSNGSKSPSDAKAGADAKSSSSTTESKSESKPSDSKPSDKSTSTTASDKSSSSSSPSSTAVKAAAS